MSMHVVYNFPLIGQPEKEAALADLVDGGVNLLNTVNCLISDIQIFHNGCKL